MDTAVRYLLKHGITHDQLENSDEFHNLIIRVLRIYLQDRKEEKRRAAINAMVNAMLPGGPESSEQEAMMQTLEALALHELRFIKFATDPAKWHIQQFGGTPRSGSKNFDWIVSALPEFRSTWLIEKTWASLVSHGLILPGPILDIDAPFDFPSWQRRVRALHFVKFVEDRAAPSD